MSTPRELESEVHTLELERDVAELQEAMVRRLLESKTIHAHVDECILVEPAMWKRLGRRQQKRIAALVADVDAHKGRHFMLKICDVHSGRELATFRRHEGVVVPTRA